MLYDRGKNKMGERQNERKRERDENWRFRIRKLKA